MGQRRNPAVVAGLLCSSACAVPACAQALSLAELVDGAFPSPSAAFVAGLAGGALLTGAVIGTVSFVGARARSHADREPRTPAEPEAALAPDEGERPAYVPRHAATDYEQIAENYVRPLSFREQVARRAKGVAAVLGERLDAGKMDGVPVIARADGTVGDVGTSWWRNAVGEEAISTAPPMAPEGADLAIPSSFGESDLDRLSDAAARTRADSIASRVAYVDEGAFPEHRTAEELDIEDLWAEALAALDERADEVAPAAPAEPVAFADVVGGEDTIDDPDGLELPTDFVPFRVPGGHPEVVDTETYVDYLLKDELSKSSSPAVRRSSRRFLRMLEGGTKPSRSLHLSDAPTGSGRPYVAKHLATKEAAQA